MISYRFKRILALWLFVPLACINAAAGVAPAIGAQAAPRMELSEAGSMLYHYAFPEKLSYVDENGTIAATSLGQAVLCFANAPMRGTPVEAGVINNIGLLDLITTKMTEKMALNVGRAAYAYESIALKTVNEVHRKQASLKAFNAEQIQAVQKTLATMAKNEVNFLKVISQPTTLVDSNLNVVDDLISPVMTNVIPGALQYRASGQQGALMAGYIKFGTKLYFESVGGTAENALNENQLPGTNPADVKKKVDAYGQRMLNQMAEEFKKLGKADPQFALYAQKIVDELEARQEPDLKMLYLQMILPQLSLIINNLVFGMPGTPTPFSKQLTEAGNKFQNHLKASPELYTAFSHMRDVVALSNIIGACLQWAGVAKTITPFAGIVLNENRDLKKHVTAEQVHLYGPMVVGALGSLVQVYSQTKSTIERYKHLKVGRDTLVPLAHFIRGTRELYLSLKDNEALYQTLPQHIVDSFEKFFGESAQAEHAEITSLALSSTFDNTDSYLFMVGRYARLAQLVATHRASFKELGSVAGYVDYLSTLARYVAPKSAAINERGQTIAFSYANFVEDEKPYLMANDLWYPAYDANKVVATSVKLGDGDPAQHMLITGVNGCGKSIVMSAMMAAVVMAHTHGIVAARENALTPFDYVIFHGNIADEKGAGLSKGVKEMFACSSIIKQVRDAGNGEVVDLARDVSDVTEVIERTRGLKGRIYLTFDELFSSTDPVSAERLSSVVIRSLIKNPNLMMVATTHNRGLTKLADQTKGLVKNAYIETDFNDKTGEIKYQRQLVSGVNHSMPALFIMKDKLRDAGNVDQSVMDIIDQAIEEQRREGGFVAKA